MATSQTSDTDCNIQKPFELEWLVGFNSSIKMLNLTNDPSEIVIAVSSGHVLSIYYEKNRTVEHLFGGHVMAIHQLDCDDSGRFLVSASLDCCVVWQRPNIGSPSAIRLFETPFGPKGKISTVSISADAKYLIIAGSLKQHEHLQFWIWSAGRIDPDDTCVLPSVEYGKIRAITFNPFSDEVQFAVTLARNVLFGTWFQETKSFAIVTPKLMGKKFFNMTTFTPSTVAVSVTEGGQGTIWLPDGASTDYKQVKSVRVANAALKQIDYVDDKLVLLDENGRLRFFDQQLRIVYMVDKDQNINVKFFMFNRCPRACRVLRYDEFELTSANDEPIESELFFAENLSRCMSVEQTPFVIRNCVAISKAGQMMRYDLVNKCSEELFIAPSPSVITTFDVDAKSNMICGGCLDGRIFLYDFLEKNLFKSVYLKDENDDIRKPVSYVLFTKCQRYIVVAIESNIHVIDVLLMAPTIKSIRPTEGDVSFMCWSIAGDRLAYYDSELKTVLLTFSIDRHVPAFEFVGKNRSHNDTITAMIFAGNYSERLVTYSKDFYFTEYDVVTSVLEGELRVLHRFRYDQMARPLCAVQLLDNESSSPGIGPCILTCGSMFKCKYWHLTQMNLLKTVVGPVIDKHPMRIMCVLDSVEGDNQRYAAFATEGKTMGLQLLPFTGNAFKHVGLQAHANQIIKLIPLPGGNKVMSLAKNELSISIWSVNRTAVDKSCEMGGGGLLPFVKALPGGRDGWLFREMQDLFYYMQILTTSLDSPEEQAVQDTIVVSEASDFMRALGFFPSEYEVNTILGELTEQRPNMAKHFKVSFGELLKIYINYKPVFGYALENLRRSMAYLCGGQTAESRVSINNPTPISNTKPNEDLLLDRDQLMEVCCAHGEHMGRLEFAKYLRVLLDDDDATMIADENVTKGKLEDKAADVMLSHLPEVFSLSDLMTNVFGLEKRDQSDDLVYANVLDPGEVDEQLKNNFKPVAEEYNNEMWDD